MHYSKPTLAFYYCTQRNNITVIDTTGILDTYRFYIFIRFNYFTLNLQHRLTILIPIIGQVKNTHYTWSMTKRTKSKSEETKSQLTMNDNQIHRGSSSFHQDKTGNRKDKGGCLYNEIV